MMLTRLKLQNFKNFADREVEFAQGINVLQGPNGSGKTTILEGIEFALYGSVAGRPGLEPLVKLGESIASVALAFSVEEAGQGREYTIFRQIGKGETGTSSTQTYISRDGVEVSTRKTAVDGQVLRLLRIAHPSYGNSCYIRQGEIRALLEAGKDREREIDRMIGLGVFEDAWKDLRRSESELEKRVAEAREDQIRAEAELENLRSVKDELSARMEEKIRVEGQIREAESTLGDLARVEEPIGAQGEFVRLETARATQAQKLSNLQDQLAQLDDRVESVKDRVLELESESLRSRNRIESLKDERDSLKERIQRAEEDILKGRESETEVEREIMRLDAELEIQNELTAAFSRLEVKGEGKCPICGSQLTAKHSRETRKGIHAKVRNLQDQIEKKGAELRRHKKSAEGPRSRIDRLASQLAEVEDELRDCEAQSSGILVTKEDNEAESRSMLDQRKELESEIERENKVLEELERSAAAAPPEGSPDHQLAEARATLMANKRIIERLEVEIPELMEKLAQQQMKKAKLEESKDRHEGLTRDLEKLVDIRWAFNNIGPYARQKVLGMVSGRARELFSRIYSGGAIREISLTQDYDMLAEFESGVRLPSKLLSIGERVMAGLALRIALAQIWQESPSTGGSEQPTTPGFFILDEPTEYLDEANVRTLAKTLAGLEALGQILIVTHDRDLMEEIGEASQVHSIVLPSPG